MLRRIERVFPLSGLRDNLLAVGLLSTTLVFFSGCNSSSKPDGSQAGDANSPTETPAKKKLANPLGTLKLAIRNRRWDEAWEASRVILADHQIDADVAGQQFSSIDPDTLVLIARAAHETDRAEQSTLLLRSACANESYQNAKRVRQTMIAMIGLGQYYDGLDFLEQALIAQPDQHETRRWLFDFYIGADERISAIEHGRTLVRARQFDVELLLALSNTERRTLDPKPLGQMVSRNPDDKRPLLGAAKSKFDESKFDDAIRLLEEIIDQHPDHHSSQAALGQSYAAARQFEKLKEWAANQTDGVQNYPGYWIAIGDWARAQSDSRSALRSFAQAATCSDPDVVQIWSRLATLLPEFSANKNGVTKELTEMVNDRAKQLSRFHQLKDRFERTGSISRAIALDIAQSLVKLGRLWEAEAWAAIAITLPEDDSVDVKGFRNELIKRLDSRSPWRNPEALPDFAALIAEFPLPKIEKIVSVNDASRKSLHSESTIASQTVAPDGDVVDWKLDDQAVTRGLRFWGRTSDSLDQPGIMLFQTLGCGGGTIDFDLDGWGDLYLAAAGGTPPNQDSAANELFRNLDGQFQPITLLARTADRGFGQGVAVGDVNEDGFPDLLVLNYGPNRLYINNGDGTFRDASDQMPTDSGDQWSSSAAIADVDRNGLADIVVVNYCASLAPVTQTCPMKDSEIMRSCSPMLFDALGDQFLRSDGDGTFTDASDNWETKTDSPGRGLGVIVGDLDGNPGNEVFIANDMTNNHYWSHTRTDSNGTQGRFALNESAMLRGIGGDDRGIPQGSMGIATGDLDRDGDMDFYVTNFDKEYNTLHTQSSSGIWQDRTGRAGLVAETAPLVAFGTEAIDINNNGELELVVTNGHVDLFSRGDEKAMYEQPMQIFRRSASGGYRSISVNSLGDYFAANHVGRGLWTIDADRDGRLDFAVTHQTEPTALVINRCENVGNWIRLDLKGRKSSRDAIGSTVQVQTSDWNHTVFRTAGDGYQCSNESLLHVGLGDVTDKAVSIVVTWPSGEEQRFERIPTREETVIVQFAM